MRDTNQARSVSNYEAKSANVNHHPHLNNRRKQYLGGDHSKRMTSLPIYSLLKAFNLQQYTNKLSDRGYGDDVYKLALLTASQRTDLVSQLKCIPGHQAKLLAFFTVIDEIYPRQAVIEQIKAFTPVNR